MVWWCFGCATGVATRRFLTAQLVEAAGCVKALLHRWCLNYRSFVFSRTLAFRRLQSWSSGKSFLDAFVFLDDDYDVRFDDVAEVDWDWLHNCQDDDQESADADLFVAGAAENVFTPEVCAAGTLVSSENDNSIGASGHAADASASVTDILALDEIEEALGGLSFCDN